MSDLDTAIADLAPDLLERINVDFEDAVLLIGRVLGGRPGATAVTAVAVDRHGVDAIVVDDGDEHRARLDFAEPVSQPNDLTAALLGLVELARTRSGDAELTSAEREIQRMQVIRTMVTEVSAVEDLHPHLRSITFRGGDLTTFEPLGPDTFLYVLLPPPGRTELTIDQTFTWEGYDRMPEAERPVGAYYTARRWSPGTSELEIWFVMHGDGGPASAWAGRASAGDPVALWGPRTAFDPPAGTDWYLVAADETGLPAAATILESLPHGVAATAFLEVDSAAERVELPESPLIDVTWLYRSGIPAGTTTLLVDAVRRVATWPGGTPYVWGGGESRAMTAIRKHVRGGLGLPREAVSLVAYWRHRDVPDDGSN